MKKQFKEEQRFRQLWLWILFGGLTCYQVYKVYKHGLFNGNYYKNLNQYMPLLILLVVLLLFWLMRLKTEIDETKITMKFTPFVHRQIRWADVKSAVVLNYSFVGGWGIRLWTSYGTVYNIKGNKGLALELMDGKKLLIGTQKEEELKHFLKSIHRYIPF